MKKVKYILCGVVLVGLFAFAGPLKETSNFFTITKNMELFANVYKELNDSYVDQVEPAGLMRTALTAMLKKLDPYTNYITEAQIEDARLKKFASGGDIGVKLIKKGEDIVISEILEGLPADKGGLKTGDIIKMIDGKETKERTVKDVELFLQGQPDTEVELEVIPFGQTSVEGKNLTREAIKPKDVTFSKMLNDTVGYVKLSTFLARGCGQFVKDEIDKLKKENENFKYLIFDLRANPGGLLSESILVSNIFLPKDELVVVTKGRDPEQVQELKTQMDAAYPDIPLVVLTNNKSASASEIVSGTMQDFDRGVVIGKRTYGKGLVQQTKDIGFNSKVKLTIAKYYINSGRCVQAVDYYGDYTDAGAKQIPDSLKNEFRTKNGRLVYDNSGVEPDILIDKDQYSPITDALLKKHAVFDYANHYASKHDSIAAPLEFEISDADFEDFVKYINGQKIETEFETEKLIKDLEKSAEEEQYFDAVKNELQQLQAKINEFKTADIRQHKKELKGLLKYEILNRYYYDKGRLEASLNDDLDVQEAFKLFGDMDRYNKILSGEAN